MKQLKNKLTKHFRFVCWRLHYGVGVEKILDRQDEVNACAHARMDIAKWDTLKAKFPREWTKLLAKRQRRLDWFKVHGSVPDGWTPPDPKDPRRSANKPINAYLARRGYTLDRFKAIPIRVGYKKGGKQTPWHMIERVNAWLQDP